MLFNTLHTAEETRALDADLIASGISSIALIKKAARAALDTLLAHWPAPEHITVFCGSGNNGGDGYLLAALAKEKNISAQVIAVGAEEKFTTDTRAAHQYALQNGVTITPWHHGETPVATLVFMRDVVAELPAETILVDALLGTGSNGAPHHAYATAIEIMNDSGLPVLALDMPSGIDADTGCAEGVAVSASVTITFVAQKRGLYTADAPDFTGEIVYDSLGAEEVPPFEDYEVTLLDAEWLLEEGLPMRPRTAHKGLFGHVMVIGGDRGMGGAVLLAAEAAARCGAGLTSAATQPEHVAAVLARRPEIMANGVTSGQALEPLLEKPTVLVIGPGLGRSAWSEQMLQQATLSGLPLVMDADALNMLAEGRVVREPRRDNWVLTPHPAEAARLLNITTADVQRDRFAAVRALQQRYGGVAILKGAGTLICGRNGDIGVCTEGNPGMASGGMGDVLAGIIGSLLAQEVAPELAARLGVSLHARAADLVAEEQGERGLLASDLIAELQGLVNP